MFAIARTNMMRVQVQVPQDAALGLKEGVVADLTVPEPVDLTDGAAVAVREMKATTAKAGS